MTTINEIKDRLNAIAFAGRSYAGADRAAVAKAYGDAVAAFDQNAAVDMAYLLDRVEELQKAITVAVAVADRYAGNAAEALEIRIMIGDPVDKLVNIAQGTATPSTSSSTSRRERRSPSRRQENEHRRTPEHRMGDHRPTSPHAAHRRDGLRRIRRGSRAPRTRHPLRPLPLRPARAPARKGHGQGRQA